MNNPPYPGSGIRYDIEAMGWTVAECAERLGCAGSDRFGTVAAMTG